MNWILVALAVNQRELSFNSTSLTLYSSALYLGRQITYFQHEWINIPVRNCLCNRFHDRSKQAVECRLTTFQLGVFDVNEGPTEHQDVWVIFRYIRQQVLQRLVFEIVWWNASMISNFSLVLKRYWYSSNHSKNGREKNVLEIIPDVVYGPAATTIWSSCRSFFFLTSSFGIEASL